MKTSKTVNLTSAEILAINTTPQAALPAESGFAYIVDKLITKWNSGTVQYATNTSLILRVVGGATICTVDLTALPNEDGEMVVDFPVGYIVKEGEALEFAEASGNPATGDISVDIQIHYDMVTA